MSHLPKEIISNPLINNLRLKKVKLHDSIKDGNKMS